jgi:hypothetical protein
MVDLPEIARPGAIACGLTPLGGVGTMPQAGWLGIPPADRLSAQYTF